LSQQASVALKTPKQFSLWRPVTVVVRRSRAMQNGKVNYSGLVGAGAAPVGG